MKVFQAIAVALCALFIFGCGAKTQTTPGPAEVLKSYFEASDNKDIAAVKRTFSKGTLKMYEDAAQKRQVSLDELIKGQVELAAGKSLKSNIELADEKIDGDAATVEAKDAANGNLEKIPFVREEGVWKIAFDKFMEDVVKKATEQMKQPPAGTDSGAESKANTGKSKTDK